MNKNLLLVLTFVVAVIVVGLLFLQTPSSKLSTKIGNSVISSTEASSVIVEYTTSSISKHSFTPYSSSAKKATKVNTASYSGPRETEGNKENIYSRVERQSSSAQNIDKIDKHIPSIKEYEKFYGERVKNMPLEKVKKELPPPPPFPSVK